MALAMMIECLSAALPASRDTAPVMELPAAGAVPRQSAFFLFLNPGMVGDPQGFGSLHVALDGILP